MNKIKSWFKYYAVIFELIGFFAAMYFIVVELCIWKG